MGIIGGMGMIDPCYLNALSFLACGVCTLAIPICETFQMFSIYALTFGFFCAASSCVRSLALVSLVGLENLSSGFGIVLFVQGIASLLGLPLASVIGDMFHSTGALFGFAASVFLLSGLLCLPLKPLTVWEIRHYQRKEALSELEADEQLQGNAEVGGAVSPEKKVSSCTKGSKEEHQCSDYLDVSSHLLRSQSLVDESANLNILIPVPTVGGSNNALDDAIKTNKSNEEPSVLTSEHETPIGKTIS